MIPLGNSERDFCIYIYFEDCMTDFEVAFVAKKFARGRSDKKSIKLVESVRQA